MKFVTGFLAIAMILCLPSPARTQTENKMNFANRKAIVINNSPFVELSEFSFENRFSQSNYRLITNLSWRNSGKIAVTAFEVVIAPYDPFNRALSSGGRWFVPGTNSADWNSLKPNQKSKDGLIGYGSEHVYTAFAFVRAVRLEDGTVWVFEESVVQHEIKKHLPAIKDFSNLNPSIEKKKE